MKKRASKLFAAFVLSAASATALAQAWPNKPVRMITPVAAGTLTDVTARYMAAQLAELWGQGVVVDNRPSAGGVVGMTALVQAAPDGYTLGYIPGSSVMVTPLLYKNPPFDVKKDLVPVVPLSKQPFMVAVNPATGIESFGDLVKRAKAQPGKIDMATLPLYTAVHLVAELLNHAAGMKLYVVPYKGASDAVMSTVSGQTHVTVGSISTMSAFVHDRRLRAIAVTSENRLAGYENVPTVGETVPGFAISSWTAMFAPAGTPPAIVEKVNRDVTKVLETPHVAAKMADFGAYTFKGSATSLADFMDQERPMWVKLVKDLDIKQK